MHSLPPDIAAALPRLERETFVRRAEWFPELESTNTYALSLAQEPDVAVPRVIGATRQTAGRGRGQNAWWSAEGALTFSLLFDPGALGLPLNRWSQVALITGLAVADVLESCLPPATVRLKWPNDVYADGRKICGILTEVPPRRTDRLVVGIGINVANSLATAPSDLQGTVVSLADLLGESCPGRGEVLTSLVVRWDWWLRRLAGDEIDFPALWRTKCYLTGERVSVHIGPEAQVGTCRGLDADGALLLETDRGIERVLAGTVRRLA
jgi:BirA family biotin operon repressor/biotin-[acetyl-CoA-carboxylase] ligase